MVDYIHIVGDHPFRSGLQVAPCSRIGNVVGGVRRYIEHGFGYRYAVHTVIVAVRQVKCVLPDIVIAHSLHGFRQFASHHALEALEPKVDDADFHAGAGEAPFIPSGYAVQSHAFADDAALQRLRRDDGADEADAVLL